MPWGVYVEDSGFSPIDGSPATVLTSPDPRGVSEGRSMPTLASTRRSVVDDFDDATSSSSSISSSSSSEADEAELADVVAAAMRAFSRPKRPAPSAAESEAVSSSRPQREGSTSLTSSAPRLFRLRQSKAEGDDGATSDCAAEAAPEPRAAAAAAPVPAPSKKVQPASVSSSASSAAAYDDNRAYTAVDSEGFLTRDECLRRAAARRAKLEEVDARERRPFAPAICRTRVKSAVITPRGGSTAAASEVDAPQPSSRFRGRRPSGSSKRWDSLYTQGLQAKAAREERQSSRRIQSDALRELVDEIECTFKPKTTEPPQGCSDQPRTAAQACEKLYRRARWEEQRHIADEIQKQRAAKEEAAVRRARSANAKNPAADRLWRDARQKQADVAKPTVPSTQGWK